MRIQICGCHDDFIQDVFTYTIQDGDNDMSTATLTLAGQDLTDDQPVIAPISRLKRLMKQTWWVVLSQKLAQFL